MPPAARGSRVAPHAWQAIERLTAVVLGHDRAMRIAHHHDVRELVEQVKRGRESA